MVGVDSTQFSQIPRAFGDPTSFPTREADIPTAWLWMKKSKARREVEMAEAYRERYGHARHSSEARRRPDQGVGAAVRERPRGVVELVQQVPAQPP